MNAGNHHTPNLESPFGMYALLYLHSRIFGKYSKDQTTWDQNKDRLGFKNYDFENVQPYVNAQVNTIPGNDFMLISLNKMTGKDWSAFFDMYGLKVSTKTAAHAPTLASGNLPATIYVLENDFPPIDMHKSLPSIGMTDNTWPRDSNEHPSKCP